ncbi:hypothetical protein PHMEG_0005717 [Phytophthora megakarya]|uniref:Uncharacterized protein n=1 Tax=Phytophthora megakarya TaxID=4795 RepID=A0A225WQS9_9STRA|nr:hypothetical protein PHMEG_0005717 [Phytophthora megakarya]
MGQSTAAHTSPMFPRPHSSIAPASLAILSTAATHTNAEVKVMAGDVTAAYRHACIHSDCVHLFAGYISEDNAIYGVLGGAVAYLHGKSTDSLGASGFYNNHWSDDHINVASDVGHRCGDINRSIRFAMTTVMGTDAVNQDKFTGWSTRQRVLGLLFNTVACSVAIPESKISKAKGLVARALSSPSLFRTDFLSLVGSLRHVATCIRPAQAFLQRLRDGERVLHRHTRVQTLPAMRDDLAWWWIILHDPALNGLPLE